MQHATQGPEKMELSELIRELRYEKGISQTVLYQGLCTRKQYVQLEYGEAVIDELLADRICSRLHVQYKMIDIILDEEQFWLRECRYGIRVQMQKRAWEIHDTIHEREVLAGCAFAVWFHARDLWHLPSVVIL